MIEATEREPSDRDVLRASLKEPARFGIVFDRHFRSVHRFLERQVGATAAEDLAAETFTVAFAQRQTFDARSVEMSARGCSGSRSTCSGIIVEPRWREGTWVCARRHVNARRSTRTQYTTALS